MIRVKTILDKVFSFVLLILVLPILFLVCLLLKVFHGKALFKQKRPGRKGQVFTIYKLKTMNDQVNERGELLPDDQRLTRLGQFIRALSIDELPQLINILKGDMSFIGPRPLLQEYLELYTVEQNRRHDVLPGITGWAQVNGRNRISWEEKFELDLYYVDNWSLSLDFKITLLTIKKVLLKDGISSEDSVTIKKFTGTEN